MEFLGQQVEYTIKVYCDNVGSVYLLYNEKFSRRTKHVYLRMQFVCRYMEYGAIKIFFTWWEENNADIYTTNVSESTYNKHKELFVIQNST